MKKLFVLAALFLSACGGCGKQDASQITTSNQTLRDLAASNAVGFCFAPAGAIRIGTQYFQSSTHGQLWNVVAFNGSLTQQQGDCLIWQGR